MLCGLRIPGNLPGGLCTSERHWFIPIIIIEFLPKNQPAAMVIHNAHLSGASGARILGNPDHEETHRIKPSPPARTAPAKVFGFAHSPTRDSPDTVMNEHRLIDQRTESQPACGIQEYHQNGNPTFGALQSPLQFSTPNAAVAGRRGSFHNPRKGTITKRWSTDLSSYSNGHQVEPLAHRDLLKLPRLHFSNGAAFGASEDMSDAVNVPALEQRRFFSSERLHHDGNVSAMEEDAEANLRPPKFRQSSELIHRPGLQHRSSWQHPKEEEDRLLNARTGGQDAKLSDRKLWLQREQELYVQAMRLKRT